MMFEKHISNPQKRKLIVGGPDDAQSVGWAKHVARHHGIEWHTLPKSEKNNLVADSFIEAIANALEDVK